MPVLDRKQSEDPALDMCGLVEEFERVFSIMCAPRTCVAGTHAESLPLQLSYRGDLRLVARA